MADASMTTTARGLAKRFPRDPFVPVLRLLRFARAHLARRIERARAAALDLGENVVLGLVEAGERKRIAWRDCVVADAGQFRHLRRLARHQANDGRSTGLSLRACSRG